jgi:hypothetical protein
MKQIYKRRNGRSLILRLRRLDRNRMSMAGFLGINVFVIAGTDALAMTEYFRRIGI